MPLTDREREILEQVVQGFTTKEIARTLQLSPRTVEVHRGHILHKLGARNTADLVRKAVEAHDTLQDAMGG
jgi:two-component system response regulator DctR